MAEVKFTKLGSRGTGTRIATISTSGDYIRVFDAGFLTMFVNVDTGAGDTVQVDISPDGSTWYNFGSYGGSGVTELIPSPYVRATFAANSSLTVYGGKQ